MSWIEKTNHDLVIKTGDGVDYIPQWVEASKSKEFNVSSFDFVGVKGSLVRRQMPKGRKFNLTIIFQGEDHLDIASAFENSADDNRPWIISHPLYGRLVVHPISLIFDNSKHNLTKIQGDILETIEDQNPKTSTNTVEEILVLKDSLDTVLSENYEAEVIPTTDDQAQLAEANEEAFEEGKKKIKINVDLEKYFNAFKKAQNAINNIISTVSGVMRAVQTVINAPALFIQSVKARIETLKTQFEKLQSSFDSLTGRNGKKTHEILGASMISAMPLAMVSGVDFTTSTGADGSQFSRREILDSLDQMLTSYNDYLVNLDALQDDEYTPDFDSQFALHNLILFAASNVKYLIQNSKQERVVYLEDDSNVILLTHRFLGLDSEDKNIEDFIRINEIGLNEHLQIKKGRRLIYFV